MFLTLRADDGTGLATAMLPPGARPDPNFRTIVVGPANSDPYTDNGPAIEILAMHYGIRLPREKCYPYG